MAKPLTRISFFLKAREVGEGGPLALEFFFYYIIFLKKLHIIIVVIFKYFKVIVLILFFIFFTLYKYDLLAWCIYKTRIIFFLVRKKQHIR
jgi:hypothetical protein